MRVRKSVLVLMLLPAAMPQFTGPVYSADDIEFNRDIRPILSENCFRCHGPSSASREAELRLDQRESAVERGAIAPGKPDESELVRRIFADDPDEVMPPASSRPPGSRRVSAVCWNW